MIIVRVDWSTFGQYFMTQHADNFIYVYEDEYYFYCYTMNNGAVIYNEYEKSEEQVQNMMFVDKYFANNPKCIKVDSVKVLGTIAQDNLQALEEEYSSELARMVEEDAKDVSTHFQSGKKIPPKLRKRLESEYQEKKALSLEKPNAKKQKREQPTDREVDAQRVAQPPTPPGDIDLESG